MKHPFFLIAGPCVIESKDLIMEIAEKVKSICDELDIKYIFKASFDKANRSSGDSYRGPGINKGLEYLSEVKTKYNLDILTDIHQPNQAEKALEVVDIIQIPAFLCRQTDLLVAAAHAIKGKDKIVNVKKGQFVAPWDMEQVVKKVSDSLDSRDNNQIWLTERGSTFGYNNLVVDFRSIEILKNFKCPVVFDATHSVQQPGGKGTCSGGQREFVAPLARAAVAVGVNGIFLEVHPDPNSALSDGPNMVPLQKLKNLLKDLKSIHESVNTEYALSSYD